MQTTAKGVFFVAAGATCWGLSATCIQLLVQDMGLPSEWIIAIRMAIAGPIFLLIALSLPSVRPNVPRAFRDGPMLVRMILFGLVGLLASQLTYFYCTALTNAGTAATLERLALLFILAWSCVASRRLPSAREIVGIVLAFVGVVLISTQGNLGTIVLPLMGLVLGVASALCMAGYMILPAKPLQRYHPFIVTGVGTCAAAVVANVFIRPWEMPIAVTGENVQVLFVLIAVGTLGAYVLYL